MNNSVITVSNLGKSYRIGHAVERAASVGQAVRRGLSAPFRYLRYRMTRATEADTIWALRNISFEVKQGELLGIIGRNGAGKSTLLKILSRITDPSEGGAIIRGRVNSLLEVGVGFHPELTGRENVYLSAALHGLKKAEIDRRFDEIVEFAGVAKFIDTPVKRYSSGMGVRLGFAVAANLDPDVLIVDEVLAVGDAAFQKKSIGMMENVAGSGRTVLFVSHQMASVEALCSRVIYLEEGRIKAIGPAKEIVPRYLQETVEVSQRYNLKERTDRTGSGDYRFDRVWFTDGQGRIVQAFRSGEPALVHALVLPRVPGAAPHLVASLCVRDRSGYRLGTLASALKNIDFTLDGPTEIIWQLDRLPFLEGEYRCDIYVGGWGGATPADYVLDAFMLPVMTSDYYGTGRAQSPGLDKIAVDFDVTARPAESAPPPSS